MPEGDTIFRAARALDQALGGRVITRFESRLAPLADLDRVEAFAGRTVERVSSAGKHILMWLSGGTGAQAAQAPDGSGPRDASLVLRTHMRMHGSWHLYRAGDRWQAPAHAMRILIETAEWTAVAFGVQVADLVRGEALDRHRPLAVLGPDLLGDFDPDEALARIRTRGAMPVHAVLLDQRVLAGIGNVFKSEILFLSGLHPDTPADRIDDPAWRGVLALAQRLLRVNVSGGQSRVERRTTTGALDPGARLWVYGRAGLPCRRCGRPIRLRKDGTDARLTYWCDGCQRE